MIPIGEHTAIVYDNWWETNKKDHTPVLVVSVDIAPNCLEGREVIVQIVADNYQDRDGVKIGRFGKATKAPPPENAAFVAATALVRAAKADGDATLYSEPLTADNLAAETAAAKANDDGVPF